MGCALGWPSLELGFGRGTAGTPLVVTGSALAEVVTEWEVENEMLLVDDESGLQPSSSVGNRR